MTQDINTKAELAEKHQVSQVSQAYHAVTLVPLNTLTICYRIVTSLEMYVLQM